MVNAYFLQAGGGDDSILSWNKQTARWRKYTGSSRIKHSIRPTRSGSKFRVMIPGFGMHWLIHPADIIYFRWSLFRWFIHSIRVVWAHVQIYLQQCDKILFWWFYVGPSFMIRSRPDYFPGNDDSKDLRITYSEPIQKSGAENPGNYQMLSTGIQTDSLSWIFIPRRWFQYFFMILCQKRQSIHCESEINWIYPETHCRIQFTRYVTTNRKCMTFYSRNHGRPDPPVGLPNSEFVELYNRSTFPINLKDWTFKYGIIQKYFHR